MKHFNHIRQTGLLLFLLLLAGRTPGHAQMPSFGTPTGVDATFLKLFGSNTTFTARMDALVLDHAGKEWARLPVDLSAAGDKLRLDLDVEQIKSRDLPGFLVQALKEVGLTRVVNLVLPERKSTYVIYPGMKSYLNLPFTQPEIEAHQNGYRLERTVLGKETVDGHPCARNKVVLQSRDKAVLEATTWEATDLRNFPVKIETREKDNVIQLTLREIKFTKADSSQFDLPADFVEYKDPQAMMMGLMKRITTGSLEIK